jgi:coproporphyrinogen dehydrogenase HemZ
MIVIQLNKKDFEYDVHSLTRGFYPQETVSVILEESQEKIEGLHIKINYKINEIALIILENNKVIIQDKIEIDFYQDRKETKNSLKRLLYKALSEYSEIVLPWGTLSGIRPIKIPVALVESGMSNVEIAQHLRKTYLLSNEKTSLSVAIANQEVHILKDIDYQEGYSIYIGIPFCPSICLYCSFSASPLHVWAKKVDLYLEALFKEVVFIADKMKDKKINTIYIGGGTPTTLSAEQLDCLLMKIEACFDLSYLQEYTVEAGRPDSVTKEKLQVLKKNKVSRISINPQTMHQRTLEVIGRHHTVEQVKDAFYMARELGFDNINMDIIVGLPGEEEEDVRFTMEELLKLVPDSITVHSLAVKRAARLNIFKDKYKEMTFTNSQKIMDLVAEYAVKMEMHPYYLYRQKNMTGNFENVGYAKIDKAGIYNILIMEEKQTIIAMGAGAATKIVKKKQIENVKGKNIERIENVKDINNYIERIDEMILRKQDAIDKMKDIIHEGT